MPGDVRHDGVGDGGDHDRADGQPVETVREIHRVGASDDDQHRKEDIEQPEIRREVFEEGHAEFRGELQLGIQDHTDAERDESLGKELLVHGEALRRTPDELHIIIRESDQSKHQRGAHHQPDIAIGDVRPQQRGQQHRKEDEHASHGRRSGLGKMTAGAVISNPLSKP